MQDTFNRLRGLLDQQVNQQAQSGPAPAAAPALPEVASAPVLALRWMREDCGLPAGTYNTDILQDCLGLPVGTAAGDIVPLGNRR